MRTMSAKKDADMTMGDRIKNRRIELGMTQQELAVKMGFDSHQVHDKKTLGIKPRTA